MERRYRPATIKPQYRALLETVLCGRLIFGATITKPPQRHIREIKDARALDFLTLQRLDCTELARTFTS